MHVMLFKINKKVMNYKINLKNIWVPKYHKKLSTTNFRFIKFYSFCFP
jgi:hypothetical protein